MRILVQYDPFKTGDPVTFEEELKSRLYVAFPKADIFVVAHPGMQIEVSGKKLNKSIWEIKQEIIKIRESINF